jgi:hypothetical protein
MGKRGQLNMNYYNLLSDLQYVRGRLNNSIVNIIGDGPRVIKDIHGDGTVWANCLKLGQSAIFKFDQIDLEPVKLGWVNVSGNSFYVMRTPVRAWSQGLTRDNTLILYCPEEQVPDNINYKWYHDTIVGIFPSYEDCLRLSGKEYKKRAFSRRFAISKDWLFYKGMIVGDIENKLPKLDPRYIYLREHLEETLDGGENANL